MHSSDSFSSFSLHTALVNDYAYSDEGREWEAEVAGCPLGQLVTITLDAATEAQTFDCRDGTFVPTDDACDGIEDCDSGLDEANCPTCNLTVTNNTSETLNEIEAGKRTQTAAAADDTDPAGSADSFLPGRHDTDKGLAGRD